MFIGKDRSCRPSRKDDSNGLKGGMRLLCGLFMKPIKPLFPSIPDLLLACLLAAALWAPWTLGRLLEKTLGG